MQGLEEARRLYERYGVDMIERLFPKWAGRIAVGLAGHGSECFGFDDELSRDHDFPEGFCLWDSKFTDYKATNTPAGRDLVREFLDAFRAEGLRVGLYYSLYRSHEKIFVDLRDAEPLV